MALKICLLGVLLFTSYSDALRLLVFFPMNAKSHSILGHGVVDNLLAAGHEVVHVTSFPKEKTVPNLLEINISKVGDRIMKSLYTQSDDLTIRKLAQTKLDHIILMDLTYELNRQIIEDPSVKDYFENPKHKFDGVIMEWFYCTFIAGIAPLFEAPLIWVASTEAHWLVLDLIDGPSNPAYTVDLFSTNSLPLNLYQRTEELYTMIKIYLVSRYYITPKEKNIYESLLTSIARKRGVTLPTFDEAVYNASLMLITSHPSIGTPYKLPQNAKYVAGYHISTEVKPLPQDLKNVIDNAKHGVIYFSMGSHLRSSDMSKQMKNDLLKMFAKLYETVIWKFEDDLENVPKNVHLVKWAPQQSILAHPNLKFFITHGGQLSTTEAIHFGVPVIGIPIMGDQYVNMNSVSNKGFGITVKWSENSIISDLTAAIKEIKTNPMYTKKAKELSEIYHNRQVTPGKDLVYWVEYVIATGGALHLRSPGISLPLYKKLYLDLFALIIIVVYLLTKKLRPIICKRCRRRPIKKEKTKYMAYKTLFLLLIYASVSVAHRVLVFFPLPSKSHSLLGYAIVDNLLAAGHEVVHITSFPRNQVRNKNFTLDIDVSEIGIRLKSASLNDEDGFTIKDLVGKKIDLVFVMSFVFEVHKQVLHNSNVKALFSDPKQKFDAVIVEWGYSNFVAGIASIFESPLIWCSTTEAYWQSLELIDEVPCPAYHVDLFSHNDTPFTFWQRLEELAVIIQRKILASIYVTPNEKIAYYSIFSAYAEKRGVTLPSYEDAIYNGSFMLINSHPTVGTAFRLPQNAKYVAGFHIKPEVQPLPKDIQKIMDEAKNGVIYFSMGSSLKSIGMSHIMQSSLIKMLAKLNETVIWKFESDLNFIQENVHFVKWAPQHSILAHPNLKFFITHGGQLSTIEALHFGVPVIGIPVMADQAQNMHSIRSKGFGITVDLTEDNLAAELLTAIEEMNRNSTYKRRAKELSAIYHNRQQSPTQELVYWIEYVIDTRGAPHLRSPALFIPFYRKLYLDLIAIIIAIQIFFVAAIKLMISLVKKTKKEKVA
ncbi:uncharacterized protein LOC111000247 [Pieris rapae]|uniref:uncharacterized protein LOC111000247 n=1 Tax=Pieris rapae TaxID=64459 RepID=UPI001E27E87E|nr:uncharacterized protein LOC111000247 [Pieris rapae]